MKKRINILWGFSLIELMVVVAIFSALAIIATQAVAVTLKGSRKTESLVKVVQDVDFVFAVMERELRNANSVDCATSTPIQLNYVSSEGVPSNFSCTGGVDGRITLNGEDLVSDKIVIDCTTGAVFVCNQSAEGVPASVEISVLANSTVNSGSEGARLTTTTRILLRNY